MQYCKLVFWHPETAQKCVFPDAGYKKIYDCLLKSTKVYLFTKKVLPDGKQAFIIHLTTNRDGCSEHLIRSFRISILG